MEITNNTHFLPAPPGLSVHMKHNGGETGSAIVIGFMTVGSDTAEMTTLTVSGDGTIETLDECVGGAREYHLDGPGIEWTCEWTEV